MTMRKNSLLTSILSGVFVLGFGMQIQAMKSNDEKTSSKSILGKRTRRLEQGGTSVRGTSVRGFESLIDSEEGRPGKRQETNNGGMVDDPIIEEFCDEFSQLSLDETETVLLPANITESSNVFDLLQDPDEPCIALPFDVLDKAYKNKFLYFRLNQMQWQEIVNLINKLMKLQQEDGIEAILADDIKKICQDWDYLFCNYLEKEILNAMCFFIDYAHIRVLIKPLCIRLARDIHNNKNREIFENLHRDFQEEVIKTLFTDVLYLDNEMIDRINQAKNTNDLALSKIMDFVVNPNIQLTSQKIIDSILYVLPIICPKLKSLFFADNQLTMLSDRIGQLTNLKILDLTHNHLAELPNSIGNLVNLRSLWLDYEVWLDGDRVMVEAVPQNLRYVTFYKRD